LSFFFSKKKKKKAVINMHENAEEKKKENKQTIKQTNVSFIYYSQEWPFLNKADIYYDLC
jgi:hypothetical protein